MDPIGFSGCPGRIWLLSDLMSEVSPATTMTLISATFELHNSGRTMKWEYDEAALPNWQPEVDSVNSPDISYTKSCYFLCHVVRSILGTCRQVKVSLLASRGTPRMFWPGKYLCSHCSPARNLTGLAAETIWNRKISDCA